MMKRRVPKFCSELKVNASDIALCFSLIEFSAKVLFPCSDVSVSDDADFLS